MATIVFDVAFLGLVGALLCPLVAFLGLHYVVGVGVSVAALVLLPHSFVDCAANDNFIFSSHYVVVAKVGRMAASKSKNKMSGRAGVPDDATPGGFTPAELEAVLGAFREGGGFSTSPSYFVAKVDDTDNGRTETVLDMEELKEAFHDNGFTIAKSTAKYFIAAKKTINGAIKVVKVYNGSKRRIRWKTIGGVKA